jgi:crotonobetainyl-CoA:carnitine CoA-transferase CaiB-like acyl-CoA transferase
VRLDDEPQRLRCPIPARGAHTAEIFAALGYSETEIASLRSAGAI